MQREDNNNLPWAYLSLGLGLLLVASQAHLMWILRELSPNIAVLQLTFNHQEFWQIWQGWGESGQAAFHRHLDWDFAHPVIYALFGYSLSRYLQLKTESQFYRQRLVVLAYLMPFAGLCDISENLCHQYALTLAVGVDDWHIPLAASFASLKWFVIAVFMVQIVSVWRKLR